jgi:hypothetical protein
LAVPLASLQKWGLNKLYLTLPVFDVLLIAEEDSTLVLLSARSDFWLLLWSYIFPPRKGTLFIQHFEFFSGHPLFFGQMTCKLRLNSDANRQSLSGP